MRFITLLTFVFILGCNSSENKNLLNFKVMKCDVKTKVCEHTMTVKFKVKKYDNTVYINVFEVDGSVRGNAFLDDCEVFDKQNWKCDGFSMIEGNPVKSSTPEKGTYREFLRINK